MRIAVLGGGLQGACVAMELAGRGARVDLFEARERCLTRASAHNEGKIHLGYVYANDPTLATARAMVRGGLSFGPLLRRWLGDAIDSLPASTPFNYVVHRSSLLSPEAVESHLLACRELALEELAGGPADYFGADPRVPPVRLSPSEVRRQYDTSAVAAVFRTAEIGVDPEALAGLVRATLGAERRINRRLGTRVVGVERRAGGLDVEYESAAHHGRRRYDQVVNALWEGRLAVDRTLGLEPPRPWMWRTKHYVRTRAGREHVPSSTIVLGAFGDVVTYLNGDSYLSWYPAGLRGVSREVEPHPSPRAGDGDAAEVRTGIVEGLRAIVPSVGRLHAATAAGTVKGGLIFAWGETDIDDPASGLHKRHAIGVHSHDGYHSVDTGKLTTAPLFARVAADRVMAAA